MANPQLHKSFAECARITTRAGSSFSVAFRFLPPDQRQAMTALYAYLRLTDDLGDEPGDAIAKEQKLQAWKAATINALKGTYSHLSFVALAWAAKQFTIPTEVLLAPIQGVIQDLTQSTFATEAHLTQYCDLVAGAVGLACLNIWGCDTPLAKPFALAAGRAFQRTNILRDIAEDLERGRVYLPQETWQRFGCPPESWKDSPPAFAELLRYELDLAKAEYATAEALLPLIPRPGRAMYWLMNRTYQALLSEVETLGPRVLQTRARVKKRKKLWLFGLAWKVRLTGLA